MGSAQESIAAIETAHACGFIQTPPADVLDQLEKIIATLSKCMGKRR